MFGKALITGASRGIGKAMAYRLAAEGYNLVLTCSKNIKKLQDIASDLSSQYNICCDAILCDAGDYKAVDLLFDKHQDIDILINNAGISYIGLLQDMSIEEWNDVINTNLNSVFYTCRRAIGPMIRNQKGRIINISSMWGSVGASTEVAYSTSKGGINAFTKALAKELAPSKIAVNAIACGVIDTDMNGCFDEQEKQELADEIPAGRFGKPEEIAEIVIKLIEAPEYLTGQIIGADGGYI